MQFISRQSSTGFGQLGTRGLSGCHRLFINVVHVVEADEREVAQEPFCCGNRLSVRDLDPGDLTRFNLSSRLLDLEAAGTWRVHTGADALPHLSLCIYGHGIRPCSGQT